MKATPVTPVDGMWSLVCAGRNHRACDPSALLDGCGCPCHSNEVSVVAQPVPLDETSREVRLVSGADCGTSGPRLSLAGVHRSAAAAPTSKPSDLAGLAAPDVPTTS